MKKPNAGGHRRRERLVKRMARLMGWPYSQTHIYTVMRRVGMAEAVAVGLDKLEEICKRLETK